MPAVPAQPDSLTLDTVRYELRRGERVLRLEKIPMELLILLARKKDQLVDRAEIIERLWGKGVFLDTEQGINTAIRKIRLVLHDDPEQPRFLQTVVGKGYRFVGPIALVGNGQMQAAPASVETRGDAADSISRRFRFWTVAAVLGGMAISAALLVALNIFGLRDRLLGRNAGIRSIAVLPLENLSGDPAQDYFADGVTDELITNLAQIGSLQVTSRTSTMHYKGTRKTLPEIARDLNVDAIVEGSVARSGNKVRVTAQLIYAPKDQHLWAGEFEGNQGDVLALQSALARAIVSKIRIKLTPRDQAQLTSTRAVNPEAHEAYLQGRYYFNKRGGFVATGIEYFRRALEKDPSYAPAYAGLADSYFLEGEFDLAQKAVSKALQLDPNLGEPHTVLAQMKVSNDWDFTGAEREFRRAIELSPSEPTAHQWFAFFLVAMTRYDEAMSEMRRARELDPLSPAIRNGMAQVLMEMGQLDEAAQQIQESLKLQPGFPDGYFTMGQIYMGKKQYQEALTALQTANEAGLSPKVFTLSEMAQGYVKSGKPREARRIIEDLKKRKNACSVYALAEIYAVLGKKDKALTSLERAYQNHCEALPWLNADRDLDALRSDPRFQNLVGRIGLPQ